ncbi:MAG TPA: hypothetical protein VFZ17_06185 [Acidimicrobiia bacterium]|nr:hypothetical protein [Acidimicrobiia bacterium]
MQRTTSGSEHALAALAAGAGVIHLAMVPSHMSEWTLEGIAFAIVGWAQIGVAVALLTRPSRTLELWAAAGSSLLVALWAVSRVTGYPIGPHVWKAETASFVDLVCVGLQVAFVIVVVVGIPRLITRSMLFAVVVPIAVVALSVAAIASPSARNHSHDDHHEESTTAHTHATTGTAVAGHSHTASSADIANLAAGHTHPDDFKPYLPMDAATFKLLGEQLSEVREITTRYPTVAEAEAAGFRRKGSFMPGQGAHYFPPPGLLAGAGSAIERPIAWLYAGTAPTSPVVGVMYSFVDFAGPNDRFHFHDDVCVGPILADGTQQTLSEAEGITASECSAEGGMYIAHAGPLMHVWTVPGWESPIGVFSHDNPLVVCTDGQRPADVTQSKGGCEGLA